MPATFTTEQKVSYSVTFVTAAGNPAVVDPNVPIVATTDNSDIATVEAAADGMSGFVVSGDTAGSALFTLTADADLSPDTNSIVLSDTVNVTAPGAAGGTLSFGTPEPK